MSEPANLLSDEARQTIASRLRFIADRLEQGEITPDSFSFDAEWHEQPPTLNGMKRRIPTGRVHLFLGYWTTAMRDLPE